MPPAKCHSPLEDAPSVVLSTIALRGETDVDPDADTVPEPEPDPVWRDEEASSPAEPDSSIPTVPRSSVD